MEKIIVSLPQPLKSFISMPKPRPLCTGAKSNLRDRILGEVERITLLLCQAKGAQWACASQKQCVLIPEGFGEQFYSNGSRPELLIRIRVCAGPALL